MKKIGLLCMSLYFALNFAYFTWFPPESIDKILCNIAAILAVGFFTLIDLLKDKK